MRYALLIACFWLMSFIVEPISAQSSVGSGSIGKSVLPVRWYPKLGPREWHYGTIMIVAWEDDFAYGLTKDSYVEEAAQLLEVKWNGRTYTASSISFNEELDLALVFFVAPKNIPTYFPVPAKSVHVGETGHVIGNTKQGRFFRLGDTSSLSFIGGDTLTLQKAYVSALNRKVRGQFNGTWEATQIQWDYTPGMLGAPFFNEKNEMIGVLQDTFAGNENVGFLAPAQKIRDFVCAYDQLKKRCAAKSTHMGK